MITTLEAHELALRFDRELFVAEGAALRAECQVLARRSQQLQARARDLQGSEDCAALRNAIATERAFIEEQASLIRRLERWHILKVQFGRVGRPC